MEIYENTTGIVRSLVLRSTLLTPLEGLPKKTRGWYNPMTPRGHKPCAPSFPCSFFRCASIGVQVSNIFPLWIVRCLPVFSLYSVQILSRILFCGFSTPTEELYHCLLDAFASQTQVTFDFSFPRWRVAIFKAPSFIEWKPMKNDASMLESILSSIQNMQKDVCRWNDRMSLFESRLEQKEREFVNTTSEDRSQLWRHFALGFWGCLKLSCM